MSSTEYVLTVIFLNERFTLRYPKRCPIFWFPHQKLTSLLQIKQFQLGLTLSDLHTMKMILLYALFLGTALTTRGFPTILTGTFLPPTNEIMNVYMLQITIAMGKSHCPRFQISILR